MKKRMYTALMAWELLILVMAMQYQSLDHLSDMYFFRSMGTELGHFLEGASRSFESGFYPPLTATLFFELIANPLQLPFTAVWLGIVSLSILYCIHRELKEPTARNYAVELPASILFCTALLGTELMFGRFDILVMLCLFLSWREWERSLFARSAFFLVVAGMLKFLPLGLLPLLFLAVPKASRKKFWIGCGWGVALGLGLPLFIMGGQALMQNIITFFTFHSGRGVQVESIWAGLDLLRGFFSGKHVTVALSHWAWHDMSIHPFVSHVALAVLGGGVLGLAAWYWKLRRMGQDYFPQFFFASCLWITSMGPVLSPQYLIWTFPLLFAWWLKELTSDAPLTWRTNAGLLLCGNLAILTHRYLLKYYMFYVDQTSLHFLLMANLRNFGLLALIFVLLPLPRLRTLRTSTHAHS